MKYEVVIGLEIHSQLKTDSKIFCGCSTSFGASPNAQTCPVCIGMPGVLPVLNKKALEYAVKAGIATNCKINRDSRFARKNYFYPDLPMGYQITQFDLPIAVNGSLDITLENGDSKTIGITRIHMENDAGKSTHDDLRDISLVNLNRAGVPLIELVTEPDLRSSKEASAFMRKIHSIVKFIGICDGNMQEGSLRCDANVSLRPLGQEEFGTRTEIKNLNSFKNIEKAIEYEIERQAELLDEGEEVIQETRLWDSDKEISVSMRSKEDAHDYRYFPDPDLLPVIIDDDWFDSIKNSIPELPEYKKKRYIEEMGLQASDADLLLSSFEISVYFEKCLELLDKPKLVANWIIGSLIVMLKNIDRDIEDSPIGPKEMVDLLNMIEKDVISGTAAKKVFDHMAESGKKPEEIVDEMGLAQVSDTSEIESIVDKVIEDNPSEVEAFMGGKNKLMGFFVGQVMKASKGKANPKIVNKLFNEKLK